MGKAKDSVVKNQHYIPRCVLRNFANDQQQVYEGSVTDKRLYLTNIINSMSERFTYEHSLIEVNLLERYFSRIEDYLSPRIIDIIRRIDTLGDSRTAYNEVHNIINSSMREFLIFYYRSGALLFEFAHGTSSPEDRVLLMVRKIISSAYIRALSNTITSNYSSCIIKSNEGNFIISDQFISTAALGIKNRFANISNRQMGLKSVLILIPISKNYYAAYYNGKSPSFLLDNKINILHEDQEEEINRIIVNNSYQKCVCNSEETLRSSLDEFEVEFPTEFIAGYEDGRTEGAVVKKELFYYQEDKKIMEFFESTEWLKYRGLNRNDRCRCGSGKKFKHCHQHQFEVANRMMGLIEKRAHDSIYAIVPNGTIELPINQWAGYSRENNEDAN